jgi:multidrug resistance protein
MDQFVDCLGNDFRRVSGPMPCPLFLRSDAESSPLASSMFAPSVPQLMAEFNSTNEELASFVVSVYVLGFAVGPLVIAPCSEMYGRLILYHICNVLFLVFTVACAISPCLNALIGFRFLAGCAGAAPLTLGGGTIADLVKQERRGVAMTLYTMGPLVGPIVGPMAGGYLARAKGWRWVFWVLAVIGGVIVVISFTYLRETYAPTILERKAEGLRATTGNRDLRSKLDSGLEPRQLFIRSIARPLRMLVLSPIILALSVFMALGYGYLYLLFTTFALVFEKQYEFGSGAVGLTYLGIGVGSMIGLVGVGAVSDRILRKKSANGKMKPEYRLLPMIICSPLMALGLFWYGWSAKERVFWLVPIVGTSVFGIDLFATMVSKPGDIPNIASLTRSHG